MFRRADDKTPRASGPEHDLVLDDLGEKLEAFQILRKSDHAATDALLGHPDRFPKAHVLAVRSLEVLDRNGPRSVNVPKALGPLKPVAQFLVQLVTRFLIRSYLASAIDNTKRLYIRREANCLRGDPSRPMLHRARIDAELLTPGFKRNPLGVPTFLLGGAVLCGALQFIQRAIVAAVSTWWAKALITLVVMLLFLAVGNRPRIPRKRLPSSL
jgi:hypothetical protein